MADRFVLTRIARLPLFDQLTQDQLEIVSDAFSAYRYEPGMVVFRQGQPSAGLMLIVSGRGVFVRTNANGIEEQIGQIGGGEYINESALFTDGYETATLRVVETMVILQLSRGRFAHLISTNPAVRANLRVPQNMGGQPPLMSSPPPPVPAVNAPPAPPVVPSRPASQAGASLPPRAPIKTAQPTPSAPSPAPAASAIPTSYTPVEAPRTSPTRLFKGQRDDETVLHVFRRHWWAFVRYSWIAVLVLILFFIIAAGVTATSGFLALTLLGVGVITAGLVLGYQYFEWKNDFFIISDQRVVRVWNHIIQMENTVSEIPLDRILEVNIEIPRGDAIARIFNYGTVDIKTAGQSGQIELPLMQNPELIQKAIFSQRERFRESQTARQRALVHADVQRAVGIGAAVVEDAQPKTNISGMDLRSDRGLFFARTRFINDEGDLVYRKHFTVWFAHIFIPFGFLVLGFSLMVLGVLLPNSILSGGIGLALGAAVTVIAALATYLADWDWRNDMFILGEQTITLIRKRPFWLQNEVDTIRLGQIENVVSDVSGFVDNLLNRGVVRIFLLGADPSQVKILGPLYDPQELQSEVSRRQQSVKSEREREEAERNRQAITDYLSVYHQTITGGAPPQPIYPQQGGTPYAAPPQQPRTASPPPSNARSGIRPPNIPRARRDDELE